MTTDAKYTIKLIRGRKVYEDDERQYPVWSKEMCDERIAQLFESGENHFDFFEKMALWVKDYAGDDLLHHWAFDCLQLLHEAYERAQAKSFETKSEKAQEPSDQLEEQSEDKPKPKLFGAPKTTPKLFARKTNNA